MEGGKLTNPSQAVGWLEVALHPHLLLNSFPSPFWLSSFPSLLRSIPSPAHFSISCPGSFPRSLYLLLFPELCFPLTSCSSTCSTSRAVGGSTIPPKSYAPGAVWLTCPAAFPSPSRWDRRGSAASERRWVEGKGERRGCSKAAIPSGSLPSQRWDTQTACFFLQNGAPVLTWRGWLTSRRGL